MTDSCSSADPAWASFCASVLATLAHTSTNTRASFVFRGTVVNVALRMHDRTVTWQVGSATAQTMDVPAELHRVLKWPGLRRRKVDDADLAALAGRR